MQEAQAPHFTHAGFLSQLRGDEEPSDNEAKSWGSRFHGVTSLFSL